MQPLYESSPAIAALPASRTKTVQGGHSKFNFGFIELAMLTPIKQNPATDAHKWFKEYMAIANTAGDLKSTLFGKQCKAFLTKI